MRPAVVEAMPDGHGVANFHDFQVDMNHKVRDVRESRLGKSRLRMHVIGSVQNDSLVEMIRVETCTPESAVIGWLVNQPSL